MGRNWRWPLAFLLASATGGAAADSLDINLNEETVRVTYGFNPETKRGLEIDLGHYFAEESASVTHLGLHVSGENWSQGGVFDIGLGGRLVYVRTKPDDAAALAFGGRVRFSPLQRLGVGVAAYYAPAVTSFLEGKSYLEASLFVDYQVLPQAFIYAGYRNIDVDLDDAEDADLDDSGHIGMKLLF